MFQKSHLTAFGGFVVGAFPRGIIVPRLAASNASHSAQGTRHLWPPSFRFHGATAANDLHLLHQGDLISDSYPQHQALGLDVTTLQARNISYIPGGEVQSSTLSPRCHNSAGQEYFICPLMGRCYVPNQGMPHLCRQGIFHLSLDGKMLCA